MNDTSEFELFTSLRWDPCLFTAQWNTWPLNPPSAFLLLPFHLDRLTEAARRFKWPAAVEALGDEPQALESLRTVCQNCVDGGDGSQRPLRIRVTLSQAGDVKARAFPTVPLDHDLLYPSTFKPDDCSSFNFPSRQLRVYIDTEPTPTSLYTSYKTTARGHYDAARTRLGISAAEPEEVLLFNGGGDVMEGSVRNVAFWRDGRWVTPGLESGCLAGTVRRWLLEQGRAIEGNIRREDVSVGEWVLLCNGVEGCLLGVISSRRGREA